jgi:hypothetical protein
MRSLAKGISARRKKKSKTDSRIPARPRWFRPGIEVLEARDVPTAIFGVRVFDDGVPVSGTIFPTGPGGIAFVGSSADFSSHIILGSTNSPGTPGGAELVLGPQSTVDVATTGTHTLRVELTSTDYSLPSGSPVLVSSSAGGDYTGGGSVVGTNQAYFDATNSPFGEPAATATPLQTATAFGTSALVYSPGAVTGTFARPNPLFSLTSVVTFTINASGGDVVNLVATTVASPNSGGGQLLTPSLNTVASETAAGVVGTADLNDTATLSGISVEGGTPPATITFTLIAPNGNTAYTETQTVTGTGNYSTTGTGTGSELATQVGLYYWNVSYDANGNTFNNSVTHNGQNDTSEQATTIPASPTINTIPNVTTVTLGTSSVTLKDTADLEGGYSPSGTITFTLYLGATLVDTETVPVTQNGTYTTPTGYTLPTTGTVTGTYQWDASYSGDTNNSAVADNNATNEQVVVSPASPAINTIPNLTAVTLGASSVTLTDTAVLSGGYSPTGTITFTLVYNSTTVDTETVTVSGNGSYSTPTGYSLPIAGTVTGSYQWNAIYNGDTNNGTASDVGAANEQVVISPAAPAINTVPSTTSVTLGTTSVTLNDTANLTGGYYPTGTITFTLHLGATLVDTETVAVSGNGSYTTPAGYALPISGAVTGTYQWDATYTGDSNNATASDVGAMNERVVVSPATPAINTVPDVTTVTLGTSSVTLHDTAVLSGGYYPTGTITFTLVYNSATVDTETVTVSGNGSYTTPGGYTLPISGTVTGSYQWNASYNGDTNNGTASDVGATNEQVVVGPASPAINTTPGQMSMTTGSGQFATIGFWHNQNGQAVIRNFDSGPGATLLGNSLATNYPNLFGAANPYTGTSLAGLTNTQVAAVYLGLWTPSGVTKNTYVQAFAVALGLYATGGAGSFNVGGNGGAFGVANGTTLTVQQILQAVNSNFNPTTGQFYGGNQTLTSQANNVLDGINMSGETPGGMTVVSSSTKLTDSATLSGGYHETGTVTFYLMGPGSTASTPFTSAVYTDVVTINGNGTYSTAMGTNPGGYLPTATGTYQWVAVYSGDGNNATVTSPFGSEPWQVGTQSPAIITTTPNVTAVTLGTGAVTLKDTGTLQDGVNPTGTITFTLVFNGNTVDTETVTVSGNGNYITPAGYTLPLTSTVTGTYQWNAVYSGDANNASDSEINDPAERTVVSPAGPAINTVAGGAVVFGSGTKLTDTAVLSGGYSPTGTITFTLYSPSHTSVYTDTVTVSGNGTYTTATGNHPGGYLPTVVGTYLWTATYSGDTNNGSATDNGHNENEAVTPAGPGITTTPSMTTPPTGSGCPVIAGEFATIGFWHNQNGQAVINAFNGSSSSTALGNWLATNFPHLFGSASPYLSSSLAGKTNAQVAAAYLGLWTPSGLTKNTFVQSFAVALGMYASTTSLGGASLVANGMAAQYGFVVTVGGGQGATWMIGSDGSAFGGQTGSLSVLQVLQTVDASFSPTTGLFYGGDQGKTSAANDVTDGINSVGDIPGGTSSMTCGSGCNGGSGNTTGKLNDSATLSGGVNPTGTITFYLFAPGVTPNATDSNNVYSDAVTVSGNGTYTTATGTNPGGYLPSAAGTYQWVAVYGGDGSNAAVTSPYGSEPWTVGAANITINTIDGGTVALGTGAKLTDSAMLAAGVNPTGTITFTLYSPTNAVVYTDIVSVSGNGTYTTATGTNPGGYLPTTTGTYQWVASYSGDGKNSPVSSNTGDEPETVTAPTPTPVGPGAAATMGFWHNKNGQALIKNFNGSANSTALANWLAGNFPNLFGSFAGQTNTQIAADFLTAFGNVGGVQGNTYAQTFSVALAIYATNPALGGGSVSAGYGFTVKAGGTGADTFNVGSNGAAFGVPNNTTLTVSQLVQILNTNYNPTTHLFYGGSQNLTSAANNVTNGINQGGDISLVTDGSTSEGGDQVLATVLHPLLTGTFVVAVDTLTGDQAAAEQARIDDAINLLNASLGSRGVTLMEISGDDSVPADVHLHLASTSVIGGVADGVLGVTSLAGTEITIVTGWNYYLGADPTAIGTSQYDFETVISHELGHALGLGHSTDTNSVMYPYLATAQVRHDLTANDLAIIDQDGGGPPEPLRAAPILGGFNSLSAAEGHVAAPTASNEVRSNLVLANAGIDVGSALSIALGGDRKGLAGVDVARAVWVGPADTLTVVRVAGEIASQSMGAALQQADWTAQAATEWSAGRYTHCDLAGDGLPKGWWLDDADADDTNLVVVGEETS